MSSRTRDHKRRLQRRRERGYLLDTSRLFGHGTQIIEFGKGGRLHPALHPVTPADERQIAKRNATPWRVAGRRFWRRLEAAVASFAYRAVNRVPAFGLLAAFAVLISMIHAATPAPFELEPAIGRLIRLRWDLGDGSDGAYSSAASDNYSAIAGVAIDGNGVYIGNFTSFTLNDGDTLTLDQRRNLLLCTGTVTLGGGATGIIDGDGNGFPGGAGGGANGGSGTGPSGGLAGLDAVGRAGGGGGAEANGTNGAGAIDPTQGIGGKQNSWLQFFLSGDTNDIVGFGGSGGGSGTAGGGGGGSGGAGGADLVIVANTVTMAAGFTWTSIGSNGVAGAGGNASGGGGGSGGSIVIMARFITIAAVAGIVLTSTGGTGGAAAGGGGAGGAGSDGHSVFLFEQWIDVGGTKMDLTALAARTDPTTETYVIPQYSPGRVGNVYQFSV